VKQVLGTVGSGMQDLVGNAKSLLGSGFTGGFTGGLTGDAAQAFSYS
jgi:hypothetical protein